MKTPQEGYGTKMYKKLQHGERECKEIGFDPYSKRLKQDYVDIFSG